MKEFINLIILSAQKGTLKKLIFSKAKAGYAKKISARLCSHRNERVLAAEYSLPDDTVSQKNLREGELEAFLTEVTPDYRQINLITALGDAELKYDKHGGTVLLGVDKLSRRHLGDITPFAIELDTLDRRKNYILSGCEDFLIKLGISDKSGRVHDKKQGKFRQINKFLEYIKEVYPKLPKEGPLRIYDLCCGKSYLSFAVYYYLSVICKRAVYMLGIDRKVEVIKFCADMARQMNFSGMEFIAGDIENTSEDSAPDMVISLHACDVATDIVLKNAVRLGAKIILSTPCCHKHLSDIISQSKLEFVTKYPKLRGKLSEAITDALRLEYLNAMGYTADATELTDPDDTPKNTLLRAYKTSSFSDEKYQSYEKLLSFIIGDKAKDYILK